MHAPTIAPEQRPLFTSPHFSRLHSRCSITLVLLLLFCSPLDALATDAGIAVKPVAIESSTPSPAAADAASASNPLATTATTTSADSSTSSPATAAANSSASNSTATAAPSPAAPAASTGVESAYPPLSSGQKLGAGSLLGSAQHSGDLSGGGLSSPEGIIKWLLSTIAILGLIFACAYLLKRSRFVQRGGGPMSVESQIALGPKERVVQLKVGERHLLLGVTANSVNFLCDLTAPAESSSRAPAFFASLSPQGPQGMVGSTDPAFVGTAPMGADYAAYQQRAFMASYPYHMAPQAKGQMQSAQGSVLEPQVAPPRVNPMQGVSAMEDEDIEPQFSRAGLPPLYAQEEIESAPNVAGVSGVSGAAGTSATVASALHSAQGLQSEALDPTAAAASAAAAGARKISAVNRRVRGRKSPHRISPNNDVTSLPDDSVLKARSRRAKRERFLEEQAQKQDSFAAMLSQSYEHQASGEKMMGATLSSERGK